MTYCGTCGEERDSCLCAPLRDSDSERLYRVKQVIAGWRMKADYDRQNADTLPPGIIREGMKVTAALQLRMADEIQQAIDG